MQTCWRLGPTARLSAKELAAAELHVAKCPRCLALLAAIERTAPPVAAEPHQRMWLRWLVPLTAAATAVAIWIAIPQQQVTPVARDAPRRRLRQRHRPLRLRWKHRSRRPCRTKPHANALTTSRPAIRWPGKSGNWRTVPRILTALLPGRAPPTLRSRQARRLLPRRRQPAPKARRPRRKPRGHGPTEDGQPAIHHRRRFARRSADSLARPVGDRCRALDGRRKDLERPVEAACTDLDHSRCGRACRLGNNLRRQKLFHDRRGRHLGARARKTGGSVLRTGGQVPSD